VGPRTGLDTVVKNNEERKTSNPIHVIYEISRSETLALVDCIYLM